MEVILTIKEMSNLVIGLFDDLAGIPFFDIFVILDYLAALFALILP